MDMDEKEKMEIEKGAQGDADADIKMKNSAKETVDDEGSSSDTDSEFKLVENEDDDDYRTVMKPEDLTEAPYPVDALVSTKKEKEAKKKAEKEAKLKKLQEKKEKLNKQKEEAKKKEKVVKDHKKANQGPSVEELLEKLTILPKGSKKPIDSTPDSYSPKYVESNWYSWWVKEGFFKPEYGLGKMSLEEAIEQRGKFVIVIPPPNVTGTLHLGHALTTAIEDALTRWNRMCGKVTLWVPGCDHAGIATQIVVEKSIAKNEGKSRHDFGREAFIKRVWEWKEQKGDTIYEQLRRMGISCDWDRESFTMGPKLSKAVVRAFVNLFDWGLIYRADRLVNWSCTLKSCISDIEVDKMDFTGRTMLSVPGYKEKIEFGVLTHFAYKIDDNTEIVVATTRPETMLGDVAVAVHPEDKRYAELIGKSAKHPFVDRDIPIIADEFVDIEFGTGCVKITPAHDPNDYEVGKRHNLSFITVIDEDGNMMNNCGEFSGMKRFHARKKVIERLTELGLFKESVEHPMVIPICSRSKDIVEPLLKAQWYVNCTDMAKQALDFVQEEKIRIIPEMHVKTWKYWMEGIRDWCISRQLWWGHQIPAYKVSGDGIDPNEDIWVAAEDEKTAMEKAKLRVPEAANIKLTRDEDVLDTWFSSGLFPFSVMGWPDDESEDLSLFYPTDLLETGTDILFFWVAKMVFMASTLTNNIPFKDVFLHSIVRDAHGRKMSKSLGNVIDPLVVISGISLPDLHKTLEEGNLDPKEIEKAKQGQKQDYPKGIPECGTDALRFALCACMTLGRDINLDVLRVQGYRFFCNKIWNAVKFSLKYLSMGDYSPSNNENPLKLTRKIELFDRMDRWILLRLGKAIQISNESLKNYNFQEATSAMYQFWLYDFCDLYLESLKPKFFDVKPETKLDSAQRLHLDVLLHCVETGLRLLSPFMPFLTEELWQRLPSFKSEKKTPSICVAKYPQADDYKAFNSVNIESEVAFMQILIHAVRSTKVTHKIPDKTKTEVCIINTDPVVDDCLKQETSTICVLSFSKNVKILEKKEDVPADFAEGIATEKCTIYISLKN